VTEHLGIKLMTLLGAEFVCWSYTTTPPLYSKVTKIHQMKLSNSVKIRKYFECLRNIFSSLYEPTQNLIFHKIFVKYEVKT